MTNERKLTFEDVIVPQHMRDAYAKMMDMRPRCFIDPLKAALLALVENPIDRIGMAGEIGEAWNKDGNAQGEMPFTSYVIRETQKRLFLAPTPALPEEVKELQRDLGTATGDEIKARIAKAYAIGLKDAK